MKCTMYSERYKVKVNFSMQDEFDEAKRIREAKKEINSRFKAERDKCHGNYTLAFTFKK